MKTCKQAVLKIFYGLVIAVLFGGCASIEGNMADSMTEYNLAVEKIQNEMLLLNIVRASKRRPMYFTSLSALRGSMKYDFQTGSLTIPFGRIGSGLNGAYSIAPSAQFSTNPIFDLTVEDSHEFIAGIMTPVPVGTVDYYWHQGWPEKILLWLFVERMEIKYEDGSKDTLDNDPETQDTFKGYRNVLETVNWETANLDIRNTPVTEADANTASQPRRMVEILNLTATVEKGERKGQKLRAEAVIRSPEGILYYLGEILRVENREKKYIPEVTFSDEECGLYPVKLFYAQATAEDKNPRVSVDYGGTTYVIPEDPNSGEGCCTDRSMHVLSLVSQLIGLQRKAEWKPVTGVVSVIGQ